METDRLLAKLAEELERTRTVPAQVVRHLNSTYGIDREEVATFLEQSLGGLEDYEIDLTLSPVFTPTFNDQALYAPLLRGEALSAAAIDALIRTLFDRPTVASLETEDGSRHSIRLREVTIERYVRRLRLDASIPESLNTRLTEVVPAVSQNLAIAVARRAIWTKPGRRELLERFLGCVAADEWRPDDLLTFLRLTETYEPTDPNDFAQRLPAWIDGVRRDAGVATSPKPFFNVRVEDLHGGGRDQRRIADPKTAERETELQCLLRLQGMFATVV